MRIEIQESEENSMIKWVLPITMALCVTWLLPVALQAGSISKDLEMAIETLGPDEEAPIIVVFADRMQLSATAIQDYAGRRSQLIRALKTRAELSQNALRGFLNTQRVKRRIPLWIINGMAISAGAEVIRRLAELPFVQTIKLDRTISLFDGPGGSANGSRMECVFNRRSGFMETWVSRRTYRGCGDGQWG